VAYSVSYEERMKQLSKIVWSEGMYLAPQHFQAQNRFFEDSLHFATSNLWNETYGFAACEVDPDALQNGILALTHARGVFEDGLAFDLPECDPLPQPRSFANLFSPTADHLTLCLAVPRWIPEGKNCELDGSPNASSRYARQLATLHDENTGRDEKQIALGRKNLQLIVESEANHTVLALPVTRVVRDGAGRFVADPVFVPPCLRVSASPRLMSLLSRLVEILEEKSAAVSQDQPGSKGKFQTGMTARQVSQFWFLHAINSSLTPLRHILLSKHGHPEDLFQEMSRLAGALCTFGMDAHPRSLPAYDHMHADVCFDALDEHIRRHLEIVVPAQAITIPLKQVGRYFYEGEVKDQRCFGRARWVLGIHSAISEAELITKTPQLLKICSAKFVPDLVKRAMAGLSLTHIQVPPSAIAAKVDSQYFGIERSGPCWEHIMKTRIVGAYVPGELPTPEMELVVILEN
jgi:type VI secretion system protein ImpJ